MGIWGDGGGEGGEVTEAHRGGAGTETTRWASQEQIGLRRGGANRGERSRSKKKLRCWGKNGKQMRHPAYKPGDVMLRITKVLEMKVQP